MLARIFVNLKNLISGVVVLVILLSTGDQVMVVPRTQRFASAQTFDEYAAVRNLLQETPESFLNCLGTSVGSVPLSDMSATEFYKDQEGGLYGSGQNSPPVNHLLMAQSKNAAITPRDAAGSPNSIGKIGFVSVGMSNTRQEFSKFQDIANGDAQKSTQVILVNGAQGAQTAERWAENGDSERPWSILSAEIQKAGLTENQVQVVWLKLANFNLTSTAIYPSYAVKLRNDMAVTVKRLKTKFSNLQTVYFSSRIYAGYTTYQLNPEPIAYESALAVRWLIQDQINGGGATGTTYANAPVLLWGPYLWADGLGPDGIAGGLPGRSDGLEWECADFEDDGTHPSLLGEVKTANLLLNFFKTHGLTKSWFLSEPGNNTTPSPTIQSRGTSTPTNTATLTPTSTLTLTPTSTKPSREITTPTLTPTPTVQPIVSQTPTNTSTSSPTLTPQPNGSPTPTATPTTTLRPRGSPTPTPGR